MTTVFDVPADLLIKKVAEEFKENDKINSPAWSNFVKTGVHKERKPELLKYLKKVVELLLEMLFTN